MHKRETIDKDEEIAIVKHAKLSGVKLVCALFCVLAIILGICFVKGIGNRKGNCSYSIANVNGHSYIFLSQNTIKGVAHDPDCPCKKESDRKTIELQVEHKKKDDGNTYIIMPTTN